MEKQFDFKISFDGETKSKRLTAKLYKGTFGRNVYNVYGMDGKFAFEATIKEVEHFIRDGHWCIEDTKYTIDKEKKGKYTIHLRDKDNNVIKTIADCYELRYAELLISCLNETETKNGTE